MNLVRKMADVVRSFWVSAPAAQVPRSLTGSSDAGETVTETLALQLTTVWACVNLLAGTIASLPIVVYRNNAQGQRVEDRGHPLSALLRESPNYDQTALDFWEFMQASLELWGDAFAAILRGSMGEIAALVPINPARMSVRRVAGTGAIEYRWTDDQGRARICLDAEMFHIRGFGGNPLGGLSPLAYGRNAIGKARAVEKSASKFFANGMRASGTLTFSEFLTDEQREIARGDMIADFVGSENTGKPMILEGGGKWEPLTFNPEESQMLESQKHSVDDLCRLYGVPPYMIGHSGSDHMGTGLEQQISAFEKFTLRRRLKRIEQAIAKQLFTPAERAEGYMVEINLDGLLRGDSAARAAFYTAMLANGSMVINEVRALENKPPVEGGDVPRMQMQMVPITEAVAPKALAPMV